MRVRTEAPTKKVDIFIPKQRKEKGKALAEEGKEKVFMFTLGLRI